MSIGVTMRLGMDATAVDRGLGGVAKKLGNFSKQVGIGAARQVGAGVSDLLGKIIMTPVQWLGDVSTWAGDLADFSRQTDVSVEKLIVMQEALRLSGAEAQDTSKMISILADNLNVAATEGGPAADALKKLGLDAQKLKSMGIDEAFYSIGKAIAEMNGSTETMVQFNDPFSKKFGTSVVTTTRKMEGLETAMADIFGSKMGYKLLRFFKDFDGSMGQARNNVGSLAHAMDGRLVEKIDTVSDALGRFENVKRSVVTIMAEQAFRFPNIDKLADATFDVLNPEKLRPFFNTLGNVFGENLEVALGGSLEGYKLSDIFTNLGKKFGDGFTEAIKISVKDLLPSWIGGSKSTSMVNPVPTLEEHTTILSDIRKNTLTATWS